MACFFDKTNSTIRKKYSNVYEWLYSELFCKGDYRLLAYKLQPNLWGGQLDCKKYLENYFNIKLDI